MIYWILATLTAFFVKGLCGFANSLIFSSVLSFGITNANISPVEVVLGYPSNLILAFKKRKFLKVRIFLLPALFILAGSLPGAFVLKYVNADAVKFIFGLVVVGMGIQMWIQETRTAKKETSSAKKVSPVFMILIGLSAGLLCGMFGVGALMAAYLTKVCPDNDTFKANISAVFVVENTFRICLYIALGLIHLDTLIQVVCLWPVMLFALFLGMKCSDRLNEKTGRKIVIILLIISGIFLLLRPILK